MPGVSFRSVATQYTGSGGTTLTIAKPAGTVDGDLLIVSVLSREGLVGNSALIAPPAGWTDVLTGAGTFMSQVVFDDGAPGQHRFFWYVGYKIASSEPASYTFTISGATPTLTDKFGQILTYQNPDAVTPVAVVGSQHVTYDVNAGIPVASIAPGIADSLVVNLLAGEQKPDDPTFTSDEVITTSAASFVTDYETPFHVTSAAGLRNNITYSAGHTPNTRRVTDDEALGNLTTFDYPWHPSTATGAFVYDGGFSPRWFTGAVSLVLTNSLVHQTVLNDLLFVQSTASVGATTIFTDGSIDYDPLAQHPGAVDAFRYGVLSPLFHLLATGPITVTIRTYATTFTFAVPHPFKAAP